MEQIKLSGNDITLGVIEKYSHGVAFNISFDADAKKNDDTHEVKAKINFDGVTLTDVISDAVRTMVIKIQADLKSRAVDAQTFADMLTTHKKEFNFNYSEIGGRKPKDPLAQANQAIAKMDADQLEALKKQLAKMKK